MNRIDELSWSRRVDVAASAAGRPRAGAPQQPKNRVYVCDRCGSRMFALSCKLICPTCGSRFDCSDLTLFFDEQDQ